MPATLYQRLVSVIDVCVTETTDIWLKGIFVKRKGEKPKIYIKSGLPPSEKLSVLLHEYVHHLHMKKFFEQENRAECELIAEGTVFYVLREFGIALSDEPVPANLIHAPDRLKHISDKIINISNEIISILKQPDAIVTP